MRTVIYKYPLRRLLEQTILMPALARPLSVAIVDGEFFVWAAVDPDARNVARRFFIWPTGVTFPEGISDDRFLGTITTQEGLRVWHIFDGGEM